MSDTLWGNFGPQTSPVWALGWAEARFGRNDSLKVLRYILIFDYTLKYNIVEYSVQCTAVCEQFCSVYYDNEPAGAESSEHEYNMTQKYTAIIKSDQTRQTILIY